MNAPKNKFRSSALVAVLAISVPSQLEPQSTPLRHGAAGQNQSAIDRPYLNLESPTVWEGDGGTTTLIFTARLDRSSPQTINASYEVLSVDGNTATAGTDYAATSGTLTFPPGETTKTVGVTVLGDTEYEGDETLTMRWTTWDGDKVLLVSFAATGTILDDDGVGTAASTGIALSISPSSATEEDGAVSVTVTATASSPVSANTPVTVSVGGGTATSGTDYTAVSDFEVEIPVGGTTGKGAFKLAPIDDAESEGSETIMVSGTATGLTVTGTTLTLSDRDRTDEASTTTGVDLSVETTEGGGVILEDGGAQKVRVYANVSIWGVKLTGSRVVKVTIGKSGDGATSGVDYHEIPTFDVIIPKLRQSGWTEVSNFTPKDDEVQEGDETISITGDIQNSSDAVYGTSMTLTDAEDDEYKGPNVSLSVNPGQVAEDANVVTVTVTATSTAYSADRRVMVSLSDGGGTATWGEDYNKVTNFDITLPKGRTSASGDFELRPVSDGVAEGDETIWITGQVNGSGSHLTGTTLTLSDDSQVTLSANPSSIGEWDSAKTVTVTATTPSAVSSDAHVIFMVGRSVGSSPDSAKNPADYTHDISGWKVLKIPANQTSATASFQLTPVQDTLPEGDEKISIWGTSTEFVKVHDGTITLVDDDVHPDVTLSASPSSVGEAAGATSVTVTATAASAVGLARTVDVAVGGTGTATSGTDYAPISGFTVTIPAYSTTGTGTFTLTPTNDRLVEGDETIGLSGTTAQATVTGANVTLTDDDNPAITLSTNPTTVSEGGSATTVTVKATASQAILSATSITVSVGGTGTATSGTDYTAVSDFTISLAAGDTTGTATFTLTPVQDSVWERTETIGVDGTGTGLTVNGAAMVMTDDDPQELTLTASPATLKESDGATDVTVTAKVSEPWSGVRSMTLWVGNGRGTATLNTDYTTDYGASGTRLVNLPANDTTVSVTFKVTPKQDAWVEGDETIGISVASVVTGGTAPDLKLIPTKLTLEDDEEVPEIDLAVDPSSVAEDTTATTVTVTAAFSNTGTYADDQTVTVSVGGSGTATRATDYAAVADFNITIPADSSSAKGTFTLTPTDDTVLEGDETIGVSGSATGLTVNGTSVTLTETDTTDLRIYVWDSVREGDPAKKQIQASIHTTNNKTFANKVDCYVWNLQAGATADWDDDYLLYSFISGSLVRPGTKTSHTIPINIGETFFSFFLPVTAKTDDLVEGDEEITIGATCTTPGITDLEVHAGTLTIEDDDSLISLATNPSSVAESAGATTVTVTASLPGTNKAPSDMQVDITVGKSGDSAVSGTDYSPVDDFTITIPKDSSSATGTFTLTPTDEQLVEWDETLTVSGTRSKTSITDATVTITDDDSPPITLSAAPSSVSEGASATSVTVTATTIWVLRWPATVTVSVGGSGTATSGTDYAAVTDFDISIAKGAKTGTGTFTLTPTQDATYEGDETISVEGSGHGPGVTGTNITLTDDDPRPIELSAAPSSVSEGAGATTVTVTATADSAVATARTVTVSVGSTGTATSGTDYAAVSDFTISIAANATTGTGTFTLTPTQDTAVEGSETIGVAGSATGETVTGTTVTLADDDSHPAVTLSASPSSVGEGASATKVTVTATADSAISSARTVIVSVGATGTATSGSDYTAVLDFTISIAANATTGSTKFTLTPAQDSVYEGSETIGVSGTSPSTTVTGTTVTLTDDDKPPVALSVSPSSVGEDAGATTVTVTATADTTVASARTVTVSVGGTGTATSGTDYTAVSDFTITIAANAKTGTGTFTLTPTQDTNVEGNESIGVSGSATGTAVTATTVTLTDDDGSASSLPTITLTASPSSVVEGESATFTVTATRPESAKTSAAQVTVSVGASGDAATEGTDYPTVGDFTLRLSAGATTGSASFTLAPTWDGTTEGDETLSVSGTATDYEVTGTSLTITEKPGITLSASPSSVGEGASATTVTVTATADTAWSATTSVTVSVGGGTATSGTDYAAVSDFTITIAANQTTGTGTFTLTPTQDATYEGSETVSVTGSATNASVTGATVTLTDDEKPPITLSASPSSVSEGASGTTVTVTATADTTIASGRTVTVSVGGTGTATSGTDYAAVSNFTITIAANTKSGTGTFTLTPTQDTSVEGNETIGVAGTSASSTVTGTTVTLADDDSHPAVTLSAAPSSVGEGASGTTVTVTATAASSITSARTVTVSVGATGTATAGTDYAAVSNFTITITANATTGTGTFTLTPTDDTAVEPSETVGVSGTSPSTTVTGTTVTLTDNDTAPPIKLSVNPRSVGEAAGATTVTVTAAFSSGFAFGSDTTVTVSVGASGDGATSGTDYAAVTDFNVTIKADSTSGTGTFTLTPTQDVVVEGNETITLSGSATGLTVNGTSVTLADDDSAPAVNLSPSPASVTEGAGAKTVTVTAALATGKTFTQDTMVTVSVGGGTATSGTDYAAVTDFNVTIKADSTSGTGTFTLTPTQDAVVESTETISLTGTATGLSVTGAGMTLADDDVHKIQLSAAPASVGEGASATTVTVTAKADSAASAARLVAVAVGRAGDGATEGTDYATVADFGILIPANDSVGKGTFTLTPTQDSSVEGNETITLSGSGTKATVTGTSVTLTDDDAVPAVNLSVAPSSVGEGGGAKSVTVTAAFSNTSTFLRDTTVTVSVGASGDGATSGTDYAAVTDFDITISANKSSGTGTFTLTPTQDSSVEGNETISVAGTVTGLTVNGTNITLSDDDAAPAVNLSVAPSSVSEGASATSVTVTARFSTANTFPADRKVTVSVGASGDGATSGTDYAAVTDFDVTISAGQTSGTGTFTLTPTQDSSVEGNESITVAGQATGLTVNGTSMTLTDDDAVPAVNLSAAPSSVGEGGGAKSVTVTARFSNTSTFPRDTTVTVTVGASGDGATSGTDYTAVTDFDVTISAGQTSGTGTFTLTPTQDSSVEGNETIGVAGTVTGLTVNGTNITLTDDDAAPAVNLSVAPSSVSEGASATTVTVTARFSTGNSFPADTTVTVSVGASGDGATSGTDYAAVSDFDITISTGQTSGTGTFTLTPTEDSSVEGNETIRVAGTVTGLTVNGTNITLTDDDGDPEVNLSVAPSSVSESAGATTVTVTAAFSNASTFLQDTTVTVSVGASGDGATSGTDYAAVSDFDITISADQTSGTGTFTLTPTEDSSVEGNETIGVAGTVAGLTVNDTNITLTDDDGAPGVNLSLAPSSVSEGADPTTVTVTAAFSNSSTYAVQRTVAVSVGGGTATSGTDYARVSDFTVTIPADSASGSATFTLTPIDDSQVEGDETISVSGATTGLTVDRATLTLADDEIDVIDLSATPASVDEGAGATAVTVTATTSAVLFERTVTVSVGSSGDAAAEGTDYASVPNFDITIPANATEGTAAFTLDPVDDSLAEGDEIFSVSGNLPNATVNGTRVTISDDDEAPAVNLSVVPAVVGEGDGATTVTVTAAFSNASTYAAAQTVTVSVGGGTATPGTDFAAVSDFRITIGAGDSSGTGTFTLDPVDDNFAEGDETIFVSGIAAALTVNGTSVTLADDDASVIRLSATPAVVAEAAGATAVTVTAALSDGSTFPANTAVTVGVGGGTATEGADYAAVSDFTITIPAGGWSGTGTFTLAPVDDAVPEGAETVPVTGAAGTMPVMGATVIIADNDHPPAPDTIRVEEGGTATELTSGAASVLANDVPSGSPTDHLAASLARGVDHGELTLNADGTFVYTHDGGETSADLFTYTVAGGGSVGGPVRVEIIVGPLNDPPVARDDTVTVVVGAVATSVSNGAQAYEERLPSVLANDSDNETPNHELTAEVVQTPTEMEPPDGFRLRDDGTFYYQYRLSSVRTDRFTYTASDGELESEPATVFIEILANDPPLFDGPYDFELPENRDGTREPVPVGRVRATDPNVAQAADAVFYRIVSGATELFSIDPKSGEIAYVGPGEDAETPPPSHALTVRATDTGGLSDDAEVRIRIVNENEGPVGREIPAQTVAVGGAVSVGVAGHFADPEGDPLTYEATTDSPEILSVTVDVDAVGIVSVGDGPERARVTVEAIDPGGLTATVSFDVQVVVPEDRARALDLGLAGIARTVATQAVDVIGARFEAASRLSRGAAAGDPLDAGAGGVGFGGVGDIIEAGVAAAARQAGYDVGGGGLGGLGTAVTSGLGGVGGGVGAGDPSGQAGGLFPPGGGPRVGGSLHGSLGTGGAGLANGRPLSVALGGDRAGGGGWTVWGGGASTDFSGRPDGFSLDGRVGAAFLGVDRRLGDRGVLGLAVSRNGGRVDFENAGGDWAGDLGARLTTAYPYARWSPDGRTDLWGMLGMGVGTVDVDDDGGSFETPGRLRMAAAGLRSDLARVGAVELAARADVFAVGMEADEVAHTVRATEGAARRARLMLDGSTDLRLSPSSRLTPSVEIGARLDGGDVETGPGMELGGGLAYANARLGLDISARGRWLAVHRDGHFGEWGGNLSVRRIPSDPSRGLSFSLEPAWGDDRSGVQALWEGHDLGPGGFGYGLEPEAATDAWQPDRLDVEIAYGAHLFAGRGSMKPFGRLRMMGAGSRHVRMGTRFEFEGAGGNVRVELLGEQRASAGGAANYGAGLNLAGSDLEVAGGLLAPFGEIVLEGASGRRLTFGTRLGPAVGGKSATRGLFQLELAAEALRRAGEAAKYGLVLRGQLGAGF